MFPTAPSHAHLHCAAAVSPPRSGCLAQGCTPPPDMQCTQRASASAKPADVISTARNVRRQTAHILHVMHNNDSALRSDHILKHDDYSDNEGGRLSMTRSQFCRFLEKQTENHMIQENNGAVQTWSRASTIGPIMIGRQVNYGMGAANPLDKVRFFEDWRDTASFHIDSATQNSMMPQAYQARSFAHPRVLLRSSRMRRAGVSASSTRCRITCEHRRPPCQVDWPGRASV